MPDTFTQLSVAEFGGLSSFVDGNQEHRAMDRDLANSRIDVTDQIVSKLLSEYLIENLTNLF